jgi:hypothetical protein
MMPQRVIENELPEWLQNAINIFERDAIKDGDTLSHQWIKFALQVPETKALSDADRLQWMLLSRVEAFKDWMLENRQIALHNVRGEGYLVVPPRDQARLAAEESMRLVKKGLQKGDKLLTNVRLAELSADEKKRHTDTQIRLTGIGGMLRKERRNIFKLLK